MLEINKTKAKQTTILLLVIFLFLILLSVLIIFTKTMRDEKLASTIQYVLEQKEEQRFIVGQRLKLNLPIANSTYFFELTDTQNRGVDNFVLITKITGMNGPMAIVFIGNDKSLEVAGIAGITETQINPLEYGITETMIHHWKKVLSESYVRGISK